MEITVNKLADALCVISSVNNLSNITGGYLFGCGVPAFFNQQT